MHGLVSILDTFTCFLALDLMFYCTEDCSSLLILSHFRFIQPDSVPIQPKSGQIKQISPHRGYISIFFWDLRKCCPGSLMVPEGSGPARPVGQAREESP